MRHENVKAPKMAEICASTTTNGIMEVEQCSAERSFPTAKADLAEGSSRADGHMQHPHKVGENARAPETWVGKEVSAMTKNLDQPAKRVVEIDTAKYQKYLDDPSLDDDQKQEIVEAIWSIMVNFVDLGFQLHPVQQARDEDACGQLSESLDRRRDKDSNETKPVDTLSNEFERASDDT